MEILRSGFQSVLGAGGGGSAETPSPADTIEKLVDRLVSSTLLDDRRDACRALKAMSRKFRVLVGAQALDPLIQVLERDAADEEIIGYALDTISNICSPDEFEEELLAAKNGNGHNLNFNSGNNGSIGEQFTEIYIKKDSNVQLIIDLLEEYEFKIRRPAIGLLTHLLMNQPRKMQEIILASRMGVSRLMDVLVDSREILRNDALLLLIQLTKGNANLQKIVAFENSFDKLVDIVEVEGCSDGGIVVEDCLRLMLNLLRNNSSNQTFFREGSYIQRISCFFDLSLDEEEIEIGWSAQKVSNMLHMLLVARTLVSPSNPTQVTMSCQNTIQSCGLFDKLCNILMASGIPADILTETINTLSETIRGNQKNQMVFSRVEAPSNPPRKALILLLMSMVNEKQPFSLRCAVLYCFQSYLFKNPTGQKEVLQTLLPSQQQSDENGIPCAPEDVTSGQLLCGGLFANDRLSNWFSAVALAHAFMDQKELKTSLLGVQLSTASGKGPILLMEHCFNILQQSGSVQSAIGLLMLISTWVDDCPTAVAQVVTIPSVIPYLTCQISSNEHDELVRLGHGMCAFLLGLCLVNNDNSVLASTQEKLMQLIEKRIGLETFLDKLSEIGKHEGYNRALKHPQLKCQDASELLFDNKFCQKFKHLEHVVVQYLTSNKTAETQSVADAGILSQYKDLIRDQDQRIQEITQANIYLQQELANAKQQLEDMTSNVQALQDQNSLLRAHQQLQLTRQLHQQPLLVSNEHSDDPGSASANGVEALEEKIKTFEQELRSRDEVIKELEIRLTVAHEEPMTVIHPDQGSVEVENLQKQLEALRRVLASRDDEIERLSSFNLTGTTTGDVTDFRLAYETLQTEQEDLLLMLSDQEARIKEYESKLADLGHPIQTED